MGERIWQKFHPVFGPDLKVGFETTFPGHVQLEELNPLYKQNNLLYDGSEIKRVYEPAIAICGSCVEDDTAQVFFRPISQNRSLYQRLVFSRKLDGGRRPRFLMECARHEEIATFGFDSFNSKDSRYLNLAYPGKKDQFIPVYVKIQSGKEGRKIYLELWAFDDEMKVMVQARRVAERKVPKFLRS